MTIADIHISALNTATGFLGTTNEGLTYRQWLIGQALAGYCSSARVSAELTEAPAIATSIVAIVDAVITVIDAEGA